MTTSVNSNATIQNIHRTSKLAEFTSKVGVWSGRAITTVKEDCKKGLHKIRDSIQVVFKHVGNVTEDPNTLSTINKRLQLGTLPLIERLADTPGRFNKLNKGLGLSRDAIDALQWIDDAVYFATRKYKKDPKLQVSGRISLFATNTFGTIAALADMGAFYLGGLAKAIGDLRIFSFLPKLVSSIPAFRNMEGLQRVAKAIGEVRVFSFVTKISLGRFALGLLTIATAFFTANSANKLIHAKTPLHKRVAALETSSNFVTTAFNAIVVAGVANVFALGVIGTLSLILVLADFTYKAIHKKKLEAV